MKSIGDLPPDLPADIAGRFHCIDAILYSKRFRMPTIDDLIENQIENIESRGIEEAESGGTSIVALPSFASYRECETTTHPDETQQAPPWQPLGGALLCAVRQSLYGISMSLRSTGLACIISLMVLGCATNAPVSTSEDRMWRAQKERQQQAAREAGRIGYIGNEGPVSN